MVAALVAVAVVRAAKAARAVAPVVTVADTAVADTGVRVLAVIAAVSVARAVAPVVTVAGTAVKAIVAGTAVKAIVAGTAVSALATIVADTAESVLDRSAAVTAVRAAKGASVAPIVIVPVVSVAVAERNAPEISGVRGLEDLVRAARVAVASPAVASPAVASPAVVTPALASPAVASPAVASPAVVTPALASRAVANGVAARAAGVPSGKEVRPAGTALSGEALVKVGPAMTSSVAEGSVASARVATSGAEAATTGEPVDATVDPPGVGGARVRIRGSAPRAVLRPGAENDAPRTCGVPSSTTATRCVRDHARSAAGRVARVIEPGRTPVTAGVAIAVEALTVPLGGPKAVGETAVVLKGVAVVPNGASPDGRTASASLSRRVSSEPLTSRRCHRMWICRACPGRCGRS
ncbi:hypothetical protein [Raineyella fluvialis]|uniref:Uncharacterized protein n=1 Tax=Raineyella fluvialis TaxID=2662261 RepID=A0A5Q2FGD1_9ACTN|nr:hypothetical protein [Raineyella fluvialis]QGF24857.1 hypothetical protein Rai3103_15895 [Raineyella fluvialis]